jgi:hypothetical protein
VKSPHIVIESMGLSTIIFGKSVSQASMGEEGKFVWGKGTIFTGIFFGSTREC